MKYTQKTFTLPAGPESVSQKQWDLAMLSPDEFTAKYLRADFEEIRRRDLVAYPNGCPILSDK